MVKKPKQLSQDSLKDLALVVAVNCVRNTVIENYHAQGKLSDNEMMAFNKEVANKLYTYFKFMFDPPSAERKEFQEMTEMLYPYNWDKPTLDTEMIEAIDITLGRKI